MDSILDILSFTGFIQGLLVGSIAIIHEKFNKAAFTYLGYLALLMGLDCICQNGLLVSTYPFIYWLNNGNLFLFGPLFYFFVRAVKSDRLPSRFELFLHFVPFILVKSGTLILGPTNLGEELLPPSFFLVLNHFLSVHGALYATIALVEAIKMSKHNTSKLKTYTFYLSIVFATGWILAFFGRQLEWLNAPISTYMWTIAYLVLLSMIFVISVQLMLYREEELPLSNTIEAADDQGEEIKAKYHRSILNLEESQRLAVLLDDAIQKEQLYLNPDLNRSILASKIDVTPHTLSQLLNNHLQKSFSEYINEFRLKEAKQKLADPAYNDFTILAIAYESGFKSKSSFQRLFKKHTGTTPSLYKKEISIGNSL